MINLPKLALTHKPITYFVLVLIVIAGLLSFLKLGQLEDPEFTVKTASIMTEYPGANPEQVELEVTDRIETKLQEMVEVKNIYSVSKAGLSIIKVDIKNEYWSDRLPQVWDSLRKKVNDVIPSLPPSAGKPQVNDDFGYVFGFLLAISSDGYSYAELEKYTKNLRKELSLVPGVARVDLWGIQPKRIYLNMNNTQIAESGLTQLNLEQTLQIQNKIVDAGLVEVGSQQFFIRPTGEFKSPTEIGSLAVIGAKALMPEKTEEKNELLYLADIAKITTGYQDPPFNLMRHNGLPAVAIALAPLPGTNVVQVGKAIDQRLTVLKKQLPIGIEVSKISWQSDLVARSIHSFLINLIESLVIVLVVLALTMGLRMGLIIGVSGLILAILATFIVMLIMHIDLQRVSLGALIIAMGMMVDNAIVVADGFLVRLQQGMERQKAAIESAKVTALPLLGATLVAVMAFYPIFASKYDTGEYARSLFIVVGISLLMSWILSQTITPLMCVSFIPDPKKTNANETLYKGRFYQGFRYLLKIAIQRYRLLFLGSMFALLLLSVYGFKFVPRMYFPDSDRLQVMVDYWLPEGTSIKKVSQSLQKLEKQILRETGVTVVNTFIGQGPPRFYLPVNPELPDSSYAQLIINLTNLPAVNHLVTSLPQWAEHHTPEAMVRVRKYAVGAFNDWKFEARFSGPAEADPKVLRRIADEAMGILGKTTYAKEVRTNWREPTYDLVPLYNQERGRWAQISRQDIANATKRSYEGIHVGLYREHDDLIPIVLRNIEAERKDAAILLDIIPVNSPLSHLSVPLAQVINGMPIKSENALIWRWDRRRAITVQASPATNITTEELRNAVLSQFNKIKLPSGYRLEWDGEYNSSQESVAALTPGVIPAVLIMLLIIVMLFNAYRPPLIIVLIIPFVFIGITFGLLITQIPFGFIALLGAMSLSGMMIKNSVVLLDEINLNRLKNISVYQAVTDAAVSRLRPVVNTAATTILAMIPLLQDVFWVSMAVTIMFGLLLGTVLTMVLVPVLYIIFYRVKIS